MRRSQGRSPGNGPREGLAIARISVSGYKSISNEQQAEVRPLTILAGANSSGKSSLMQPLLLLKQTLEASYDPGPLLLDGPNVRFTSADELLSRVGAGKQAEVFSVGVSTASQGSVSVSFGKQAKKGLVLRQTQFEGDTGSFVLREDMTHDEIGAALPEEYKKFLEFFARDVARPQWTVLRNRCFLLPGVRVRTRGPSEDRVIGTPPMGVFESCLTGVIHLPGLRGNPERTYPVTAVGEEFPGTFEKYAASVIAQWDAEGETQKLQKLGKNAERLGLTWKVTARRITDTRVELKVGRLPHPLRGGAQDLVNVADVGFGVSQALPVLVALLAAEPGQLVYLEQPEIHLHPRAQYRLAEMLVEAADRGVRVVAETHSALVLLGVQSIVAGEGIDPRKVKLHWFTRGDDGSTRVTSADLDGSGAFGDWPEDFAETELRATNLYLDAVEARTGKVANGQEDEKAPGH